MNEEPPLDQRAERRDRRREAERARIKKHGAGTGDMYRQAVLKRLRAIAEKKRGKRR